MFHSIFAWIQQVVCFLIIFSAVLEVLPGKQYQRYVRFYMGIVFLLLVVSPFFKFGGTSNFFQKKLEQKEYEQMMRQIEQKEQYFRTEDFLGALSDIEEDVAKEENFKAEERSHENAESEIKIEVEDIRVGNENQNISEKGDGRK